jgi:NAD(P)-dependent dehydrogenase (short-subunit alcohol dehydrogenase family)
MGILDRKVVVVTGAGRGIGYAVSKYGLEHGASVVMADVVPERVEEALSRLEEYGERVSGVVETVATSTGAQNIINQALERYGQVDALVNNAAITRDKLLAKMSEEEFDEVIATNLKGPFNCAKAVIPHMMERKQGRIVNIIAASAVAGNVGQTNYAAAKGGLLAMTLTWSKELLRYNIMVNAVIPAAWTEMSQSIPKEALIKAVGEAMYHRLRSRKPEQVAPVIAYLVSDEAKEVTGQCFGIAGQELSVWKYAQPQRTVKTDQEAWSIQSIKQFVENEGDALWPKPVSPFL